MAEPRKKYIEAAYQLLLDNAPSDVSIRKVAEQAGTSSAAIYRHFGTIDELITIASFHFLRPYTNDARILSEVDLNPLELNLQLWECLAYYAFRNAAVFQNLFFGNGSYGTIDEAAKVYYQDYPEELEDMPDFMQSMLKGSTLFDREAVLLDRASEIGMLSKASADHLCRADTYLFRGMLAAACDCRTPRAMRDLTREFVQLLIQFYRARLEEGYSILVVEPDKHIPTIGERGGVSHTCQISVIRTEPGEGTPARAV